MPFSLLFSIDWARAIIIEVFMLPYSISPFNLFIL